MNRYIIGFGLRENIGWIYARSEDDALAKATALSMMDGCLDDDLADTTFAEPWDDWYARDLGLLYLDAMERGWETAEPVAGGGEKYGALKREIIGEAT